MSDQAAMREPNISDVLQVLHKQQRSIDLNTLQNVGAINAAEHIRIIKMLQSPDRENHTVANELIKNKIQQL